MGSNRAGANLRRKRKRQLKNLDTYVAALDRKEKAAAPAKKAAAPVKKAAPAKKIAKATK